MANTIEITGYVNNVKEFGQGNYSGSLSIGTKTRVDGEDVWKNGYMNISTKHPITDGTKITAKGFLTYDFWVDKTTGKDRQAPKIYAMEIIQE